MDKSEAVGPFWIDYHPRVPSSGFIDAERVVHETFCTVEERDAVARLGNRSTFAKGEDGA
jgi:hypothetical protein